jgi:hypothetical protein
LVLELETQLVFSLELALGEEELASVFCSTNTNKANSRVASNSTEEGVEATTTKANPLA